MTKTKLGGLLTSRRFLPLFVVQFGGALSDNILRNAIVVMIGFGILSVELTAAQQALLIQTALAIFILPFFLFSALAGKVADNCPNLTVAIRFLKAAEVVTSVIAAVGFALGSLPMLLVALGLAGVQSTFFGPFKYSMLPLILEPQELLGGNALINASTYLAILLGVLIGSVLGVTTNPQLLATSALSLIALLGLLASMFMLPVVNQASSGWRASISLNFIGQTSKLIKQFAQHGSVVRLVILISWFWATGAVLLSQLPVIVSSVLGYDIASYLLLLLIVCCGIAIGSLVSTLVLNGKTSTRLAPYGLFGFATILLFPVWPLTEVSPTAELAELVEFVQASSFVPITLSLFLLASAMGLYVVPLYAALQLVVKREIRGHMIAANNIFNSLFVVVFVVVAGSLVGFIGHTGKASYALFVVMGIIGLLLAVWSVPSLKKVEAELLSG